MWPEKFEFILDNAEEVTLDIRPAAEEGAHSDVAHRQALKVRLTQEEYESIWPLAEARYRLAGKFHGKAITLIVNNPHYHRWHPASAGSVAMTSDSGKEYTIPYMTVYFLLDDVRETAAA
ncbi:MULTISPECIES: hypothetical protein [Rhizobium/Agrobacterium group]|uniref:hypothetical protein n=1 Tax=Rhizobium/Agrobacterium group TaxID=227290 RepID=UPI001AE9051B|nr:hypothetical protein [Neorhizobium galegae]